MQFHNHAFILAAIEALHRHGSWTGKTHLQKALSLLRDRGDVSVPFEFVLYRHGPYSFELESELEEMRSYGAVALEPNLEGFGVVLKAGHNAKYVAQRAAVSPEELAAIDRVAAFIGRRNVHDLERMATASWIRRREGLAASRDVIRRLHALKPHVSPPDAERADTQVQEWLAQTADATGEPASA